MKKQRTIIMKRHFIHALMGLVFSLSLFSSIVLAVPDTWTRKADMPAAMDCLSASVVNRKIYAIGGWNNTGPLSIVEEYNPVADTWTQKADMPTVRWNLSTCVVNGKIYAIGGLSLTGIVSSILSTVDEYNPVSDIWTRKADMPTARWNLSASAVNGKIYAIGGAKDPRSNDILSTVEEYDPVSDTWTTKHDMPAARYGLSTSVVNGKIYVIGGRGNNDDGFISAVEEYNPVSDKWTRKADMPTARNLLSTCVVNGKIYAIGGYIWDGINFTILQTVEEYNPVSDKWTKEADMPTARECFATSAVNGKIYAIGGGNSIDGNSHLSAVEEYDTGFADVEAKGKLATKWGKLKGDE